MKALTIKILIISIIFLADLNFTFAQEWKNLRLYKKETGNSSLLNGCWLKKDRKKQTKIWQQANKYNLNTKNGNQKYKTICQIRDFYFWFDNERKSQGHEIKWIGLASIAANQLSNLDIAFVRVFIVQNKELVLFANEGVKLVFAFAFPQLNSVYFSRNKIKDKDAEIWDQNYGMKEQCEILEPLYKNLSKKSLRKLERMAKGKGIYNIGVPKNLKFEGDIINCKTRFEHGIKKLLPYYNSKR